MTIRGRLKRLGKRSTPCPLCGHGAEDQGADKGLWDERLRVATLEELKQLETILARLEARIGKGTDAG